MLKRRKILAVASGGGHWLQMLKIRDAFAEHEVAYVGVKEMYYSDIIPNRFYTVPDFSRLQRASLIPALIKLTKILLSERPDVVVTTGAAPGLLALRLAKLLGMKTVWIDSIANVEQLSYSGSKAKKYADLWLTQWPHLASENGPKYVGSVL